jgi:hypothetical protein
MSPGARSTWSFGGQASRAQTGDPDVQQCRGRTGRRREATVCLARLEEQVQPIISWTAMGSDLIYDSVRTKGRTPSSSCSRDFASLR